MGAEEERAKAGDPFADLLDQIFHEPTVEELFIQLFQPSALRQVFEERFSRTPSKGVDRLNGYHFASRVDFVLGSVANKCLDGTFRFSPYLENLKSKGRDKPPRLVSIPTIRDRIVLHQLNKVIAHAFKNCVPRNVAKSYIATITEDFENLDVQNTYVCGCDIKTFYDLIQRERLSRILERSLACNRALKLITRAITTPTVSKTTRRRQYAGLVSTRGVPQGLAISNILAAIYLEDVDTAMKTLGVRYFRYVDDVLMYGAEDRVRAAHKSLAARLRRRGLSIHKIGSGKTHLGPLTTPFSYLGYYFRLPNVTVRESSIEKLLQSIAAKFTEYTQTKQRKIERFRYLNEARLAEIFVLELNERISGAISGKRKYGWIAYYGQINDLSLLHRLDHAVRGMFGRMREFDNTAPKSLKRFARAYFEMRYKNGGSYVRNYDHLVSRVEKLKFLLERGRIGPDEELTDSEIGARFDSYLRYTLSQMQADEQLLY